MVPVFAQPLSDKTGFRTIFDVVVDGQAFSVETVSNFDVRNLVFEDGKIVLDIWSSIENNFGEMQIPQNVTKGALQFYLDGQKIDAKVLQNNRISFVTLEFAGNGTHTLEIIGEASAADLPEPLDETTKSDQFMVVAAVMGIVVAVGAGSTIAFYIKRKKSP
jgi:hypothetical protein